MASAIGPDIVTDGLVLSIDPASKRCNATSGGTLLSNLALPGTSSSVINGTTSESVVSLDGTNDYIHVNNSVTSTILSPQVATFSIWFKADAGSFSNDNICSFSNHEML